MNTIQDVLEYKIISVAGYTLHIYEIVVVAALLAIGYLVDRLIRKLLNRSSMDSGTSYAFHRIVHYLLILIVFFLSMKTLGVDISPLLMGSSVILVGIGLGLQNLFLDFISGIIILFERGIRVGDILDMDGTMGRIVKISMRTTQLLTTDNKLLIIPNSSLTKEKLINYSSHNADNSFSIEVGVEYEANLELAQRLLIEAAEEDESVSKEMGPFVRLVSFGDSALILRLHFYSNDPFMIGKTRSDIRIRILKKFAANGIAIPNKILTVIRE